MADNNFPFLWPHTKRITIDGIVLRNKELFSLKKIKIKTWSRSFFSFHFVIFAYESFDMTTTNRTDKRLGLRKIEMMKIRPYTHIHIIIPYWQMTDIFLFQYQTFVSFLLLSFFLVISWNRMLKTEKCFSSMLKSRIYAYLFLLLLLLNGTKKMEISLYTEERWEEHWK